MKLVAYVRVSSTGQVEHGQGLNMQRTAIRAWAKANGHKIVLWCEDAGVSGAKCALDRHGLTDALTALRDRKASGLVFRDLERLARALHIQEAVLAEAWQGKDVRVFTVDGEVLRDDPDDPMRTAMRQVTGVFAELDRRLTVRKLKQGRDAKAAKGGHANGRYAYGTDRDGPVPAEQAALTRMTALRASGASTYAIARDLTKRGVPTKRGGAWSSASVSRILSRQ
jgi:DNA invertase Pin-like site-specific DNA recombinase